MSGMVRCGVVWFWLSYIVFADIFSSQATGILLRKKLALTDWVIFEKFDEVGGTWYQLSTGSKGGNSRLLIVLSFASSSYFVDAIYLDRQTDFTLVLINRTSTLASHVTFLATTTR
jgi:hypothetical protein